ncbi:MAG: hypothetical protein IJI21_00335 [Clostridia bacterium]|nr:hypothetical protein [Clostridia bacterium]
MTQVLSSFMHGYPGAVSRSMDNLIVSLRNAEEVPIQPGAPLFLAEDGEGVVPAGRDADPARFVGVAVRNPARTPDVYGASVAPYGPGDPVDVLVRGSVVVRLPNETCEPGGKVYIALVDGSFTAQAAGDETIELAGCSWRGLSGMADPCAELVIRVRNLI